MSSMSSSDKLDIVYLAQDNLEGQFARPQAIARELARSFRVLFVNSFGYSLPRWALDRFAAKTPRHRVGLFSVAPNLWTVGFVPSLPNRGDFDWVRSVNIWLAAQQLRRAIRTLGFQNLVLWIGLVYAAPLVNLIPAALVCYDCMDNFPAFFRGRRRRAAEILGAQLLQASDLVIAASEELYAKCRAANPYVHLVRNGVRASDYARGAISLPAELRNLPRPILGFWGTFGPWLDVELLQALALRYSQGSLVLVGPVKDAPVGGLSGLRNVHFLGMRPHDEGPRYLRGFDVCLIPFRQNELTTAVNPIKFYEYCAAGRPTVSVALPELAPYQHLCYLAHSREEFLQAVEASLKESENSGIVTELGISRRKVADDNSWEVRGRQIEAILATGMRRKKDRD